MRKTAALLAAAAVVLVGATTSSAAPTGAPKAPAPAAAVAWVPTMSQATYLATIRALLAGEPGDSQSDATLVDGGKSICADVDNGATADTFEEQMDTYDLNRAVYRVIIRSSILTFCPQHSAVIR